LCFRPHASGPTLNGRGGTKGGMDRLGVVNRLELRIRVHLISERRGGDLPRYKVEKLGKRNLWGGRVKPRRKQTLYLENGKKSVVDSYPWKIKRKCLRQKKLETCEKKAGGEGGDTR